MPATSATIRAELVEALRLDLVGPDNDHAFANELLPESPRRWYLTGFLVPIGAPEEQRTDAQAIEELDAGGDIDGDDAGPPDRGAAKKSFLPSSLGLSVLIPPAVSSLQVRVVFGDYDWEKGDDEEPGTDAPMETPDTDTGGGRRGGYRRIPRDESVDVTLPLAGSGPERVPVPNSQGLLLVVTCRTVPDTGELPSGTRSVSVFLVNEREPDPERGYRRFVFQTGLVLTAAEPLVARPDLRGCGNGECTAEWDERVGDLQYRDVCEYAVGHGVAAEPVPGSDGRSVRSVWIPAAEVERVAPAVLSGVELGMEALAELKDAEEACARLLPLVSQYRDWIAVQSRKYPELSPKRTATAASLLAAAGQAADRIEAGIHLLAEPDALYAFRIANRAMAESARRREAQRLATTPDKVNPPRWRPFQLAYLLMTLRGIADPLHPDRETVDLLFFPTGGGKTEAYFGLAAFTMVLRRLTHPGRRSCGVSVLMRYTLRLLTLDQLGRAAALMCALELQRVKDARLGDWPFEIGLWVGSAATPNRMGYRGYQGPGADNTAYIRTNHFKREPRRYPRPIPLENCPWCGTQFEADSFRLTPNPNQPLNLEIRCAHYECEFSADRALPIVAVDAPIYRRLPAFLIATVDKFASLPWTGETGALFGKVDRFDAQGFYGPCDAHDRQALGGQLPPPDLIIQDELHLISGPLGTIAGLYETAIDALATQDIAGHKVRPKVIASTATVRRAERQIRALFGRESIAIFPPPGADRADSFFAITEPSSQTPARLYVGVAAQGRSLKVVLLRSALALLSAAQTLWDREGGKKNPANPVDPYMTFLGYFNSLRELGGSRRIFEDEVRTRLGQYSRRRRLDCLDGLFSDRTIAYEPLELTSRVNTADVAATKRRLALAFHEKERVDVAMATNMISVGLDIMRLGLMVVLGQPKTSAEYIQTTSRVGRDMARPGLVVSLLNVHKPRDRSHYEHFGAYHASFYRAVEATSVTPFSPRALDRALVGALIALARQGHAVMTPPQGAGRIQTEREVLEFVAQCFADRAYRHTEASEEVATALREQVLQTCRGLLDDWAAIAGQFQITNTRLQYQKWETAGPQRLLYDFLDPELPALHDLRRRFRANRSMRDVENSVDLFIKNLNDWGSRS